MTDISVNSVTKSISKVSLLRSILSEPDGTGSAARACICMIVAFVVGFGTALAWKINKPISIAEFDSFLQASGIFITTTCGSLYFINKGANVLNNKTDKGS